MRSLTVRLPDQLAIEVEAESRERSCAMSDIVRERLQRSAGLARDLSARLTLIADLTGSADGLPSDLSGQTKKYLKPWALARSLLVDAGFPVAIL